MDNSANVIGSFLQSELSIVKQRGVEISREFNSERRGRSVRCKKIKARQHELGSIVACNTCWALSTRSLGKELKRFLIPGRELPDIVGVRAN